MVAKHIACIGLLVLAGQIAAGADADAGRVERYCEMAQGAIARFAQEPSRPPRPDAPALAVELARVRGNGGDKALVRQLVIEAPAPAWWDEKTRGNGYSWKLDQAVAYATIGESEQARKLADEIATQIQHLPDAGLFAISDLSYARIALGEVPKPLAKGMDLQSYAWMAARMGNRELCQQLLGEMRNAALAATGEERGTAWRELIQLRIRIGEVDAALADMPQVVAPYRHYELVVEAAEQFVSSGEMAKSHAAFAQALRAAQPSEENFLGIGGLMSVAEAAIRQGDIQVAREATELALREVGGESHELMGHLALLRAATGLPVDLAEQRTKILEIRSSAATQEAQKPEERSYLDAATARELVALAAAHACLGQLEQTRELIAEARAVCAPEEWYQIPSGLEEIPVAVAEHGNIRQAVALAEELLPERDNRGGITCTIADQAVRQGKLDDALDCLTRFGDTRVGRRYRALAACRIGVQLVRDQAWDRLDALVNAQEDPYVRSVLCLRIVREIQGTGHWGIGWSLS